MSFARFSAEDQKLFASAASLVGKFSLHVLKKRLDEGMWSREELGGEDLPNILGQKINQGLLRRAGGRELSMLFDSIDWGCRRVLRRRLPPNDRRLVRGFSGERKPSALVFRSLQTLLCSPELAGVDLLLQAGLHHLARAMADLDSSEVHRIIGSLPVSWGWGVRAAWFRLARVDEARAQAGQLRAQILGEA